MERIIGQHVNPRFLPSLEKQADLIYFEGPLLSLFENSEGEPYLFLWADVDESANRWIVLRVSSERLYAYLNRTTPLRPLVENPADGYVFVADVVRPEEFRDVWLVRPADIPVSYLPVVDSLYDFAPEHAEIDLLALARRLGAPVLDLHLVRGKGIAFGTAEMTTLGTMLRSTGELAESIAISLFARGDNRSGTSREDARAYGQFEFVAKKAASFSAIMRPLITQHNLFELADRTGQVVETMIRLLSNTPDYDRFRESAAVHEETVIRHLENLVKDVQARGIDLELRWATPAQAQLQSVPIDVATSTRILENINRLEHEEAVDFATQGVFVAIDTTKRTYRFRSIAGKESSGKFDPRMGYPVTHISFETEYRVYMNRKTLKASGKKKPQIVDVIGQVDPVGPLGSG